MRTPTLCSPVGCALLLAALLLLTGSHCQSLPRVVPPAEMRDLAYAFLLAALLLPTGSHCYNCLPYFYGEYCLNKCGRCRGGAVFCDVRDGYCNQGCADGYVGVHCELTCPPGRFGQYCVSKCGHCGIERPVCDPESGQCLKSCLPGYKRPYCSEHCPAGTYGLDCLLPCGHCSFDFPTCNHTTGECTLACEDGYEMPLCTQRVSHLANGKTILMVVFIIALCCAVCMYWRSKPQLKPPQGRMGEPAVPAVSAAIKDMKTALYRRALREPPIPDFESDEAPLQP